MGEFLRYWGLDWMAMALSLFSVYLLGNKNRNGFLVFAMSNATWIFLGLTWMTSLGIAVGNTVFLFMNIRGFVNWRRQERPSGRE
jgi:hypothetical protein